MPNNAGLRQPEHEAEIQSQRDIQENENDNVRATVFSLRAATRRFVNDENISVQNHRPEAVQKRAA